MPTSEAGMQVLIIDDNDNSFNGALILTVFSSAYLLILVHQNGRVPGKFAVREMTWLVSVCVDLVACLTVSTVLCMQFPGPQCPMCVLSTIT